VTHTFFVSAAYIISAIVIGGMIAWIMLDQAARKRELNELEKRGVKRRSAEAKS
jgi:heme exporter protein D